MPNSTHVQEKRVPLTPLNGNQQTAPASVKLTKAEPVVAVDAAENDLSPHNFFGNIASAFSEVAAGFAAAMQSAIDGPAIDSPVGTTRRRGVSLDLAAAMQSAIDGPAIDGPAIDPAVVMKRPGVSLDELVYCTEEEHAAATRMQAQIRGNLVRAALEGGRAADGVGARPPTPPPPAPDMPAVRSDAPGAGEPQTRAKTTVATAPAADTQPSAGSNVTKKVSIHAEQAEKKRTGKAFEKKKADDAKKKAAAPLSLAMPIREQERKIPVQASGHNKGISSLEAGRRSLTKMHNFNVNVDSPVNIETPHRPSMVKTPLPRKTPAKIDKDFFPLTPAMAPKSHKMGRTQKVPVALPPGTRLNVWWSGEDEPFECEVKEWQLVSAGASAHRDMSRYTPMVRRNVQRYVHHCQYEGGVISHDLTQIVFEIIPGTFPFDSKFVWAKIDDGRPWWPGKLITWSEVPEKARKTLRAKYESIGSNGSAICLFPSLKPTFAYLEMKEIITYEQGEELKYSSQKGMGTGIVFKEACREAKQHSVSTWDTCFTPMRRA